MFTEKDSRLKDLCSKASQEQDPGKLLVIVEEINRMLDEKQERVEERRKRPNQL